ncbi:MAG: hypothetical protein HYT94_01040 [Parcubacteria group bacterium]|nr:hypothetical protein [Parcubacteria group bacterium]
MLTENEEKMLILIFLEEGSASVKTARKVFGWSDEVLNETRKSLVSKELMHDLTPDLQFGKNGRTEALRIQMRISFPVKESRCERKRVSPYDTNAVAHHVRESLKRS